MKKIVLSMTTLLTAGLLMSACNGGEKKEEQPKYDDRPNETYVLGEVAEESMSYYRAYEVNFYDNNVYEFVSTQITYGYSMNLGTSVSVAYGTYEQGEVVDGVGKFTLNKASEVVLSSFSKAGGFNITINTADSKQSYPTELPASGEGEKIYANSKADVINAYGMGTVIYTEKNTLSFLDPNDDASTKAVIEKASGDVKNVLHKNFKQVQTASVISPAAVGDAYVVTHLHIFEDNSYSAFQTTVTFGYSMVLGTTVVNTYGQGQYGTSEDGFTPYTLSSADDVNLNSYSKAGGFNIAINTALASQTYPTELPASGEGEKVYANSKADVVNAYGKQSTVYTNDANNGMELENPNA